MLAKIEDVYDFSSIPNTLRDYILENQDPSYTLVNLCEDNKLNWDLIIGKKGVIDGYNTQMFTIPIYITVILDNGMGDINSMNTKRVQCGERRFTRYLPIPPICYDDTSGYPISYEQYVTNILKLTPLITENDYNPKDFEVYIPEGIPEIDNWVIGG